MIAFSDSDPPWEQVWISEEDCHASDGGAGDGGAGDGAGDSGDGGAMKTMATPTILMMK